MGSPASRPPKPAGPLIAQPIVTYVFTAITLLVGLLFSGAGLYNILVLRGTLGWWALLVGVPILFFTVRHFFAARAKSEAFKEEVRAYKLAREQEREEARVQASEQERAQASEQQRAQASEQQRAQAATTPNDSKIL